LRFFYFLNLSFILNSPIFFAFLQNTTRGSKYKIIGNLRFLLKKSKNYADKPKSSRKYSEVKDKEQPASIIQENGCNEMDETDARILWELLEDGRKTFATIAKNCNVSQDVVWKRYKEMKENGIIVGATIQFNYRNFGHSGVAMVLLNVESQYVNDVLSRLNKIPDVRSTRNYNATNNISSIAMLRDLSDLDVVKETITRQNPVNEMKTYIWTDVRNIPENIVTSFLKETPNNTTSGSSSFRKINQLKLDEIDTQIIDKLTADGRIPFSKIAQELGISTETVSRRYERLKKNSYIKASIQINPKKLGFKIILDTRISIAIQSETNKIVETLCKIPGVSHVVKLSGDYDLSVAVLIKDCDDIVAFNDKLTKIPYIKKIECSMRETYRWPGPRQYLTTF
jgi:Lrp/AsnC family transcriptional regulator for asnA, asnC and gidA